MLTKINMKKTIFAAILLMAPMALMAQGGEYTIKGEEIGRAHV